MPAGIYIRTKEHCKKISEAKMGHTVSSETRKKISDMKRGEKHPLFGKHHSKETIEKMRLKKLGKKASEETRRRLSESHIGKHQSLETRLKRSKTMTGKSHPNKSHPVSDKTRKRLSEVNKGKHHSEATRRKISEVQIGKWCGEQNPNWKGGISFEPYCIKFNDEFKERVRAFFGYYCIECGTPQNGERLHVHHVNFNKQSCCDNTTPLFVPLCRSCHTKTGRNRQHWINHFSDMINQYYGGKCYLSKTEMPRTPGATV